MASSAIKSGALVTLAELHSSSPFFKDGTSLRVTGKLQEYSVETAIASCRWKCYPKDRYPTTEGSKLSNRVHVPVYLRTLNI
ncbi:hypothetical protein LWI28_024927 [Acer negundo]|uniref:Uncharacterized protein n=1 Tax=Acer negundo TaxID=4023 RepID=A0AAD5IKC5_ACENE|nr:hypothetical protein LWI28_024927 [Acer negundo]KAK4838191.1 hypothetical protein QYF36_011764 [Acer negundo]